ncbi:cell adhesion molecule-related/down-regulated by oncogenes-like [Amphiura filiformis]|uniref:cell adhesion molecule-related/down-regulated by oncogenes-like n=1 Tax=Amphiura filiformis TaxID=82378 RepID=UPI003B220F93
MKLRTDNVIRLDISYPLLNEDYFSLQISRVSIDDSKSYQCVLVSALNDIQAESRPSILHVQYPPDDQLYPQCTIDSNPSDAKLVTLKCRSETAYPPVRLYWISSKGRLVPNTQFNQFTEAYLDIAIPSSSDYVCISNYTSGSEQINRRCKLNAPKILLSIENKEIIEGGEAVYMCSVDAKPKSDDLSWTSVPALVARNKTIAYDGNSVSMLILSNITASDNGMEIICSSKNLLGTNFEKNVLIVKTFGSSTGIYVPPFVVTLKPVIAKVVVGDMVTFTCEGSTYRSSYKYKWFYCDTEITPQTTSDKFLINRISTKRLSVRKVDIMDNNATISCVVSVDGQERVARAKLFVIQTETASAPSDAMSKSNYQTKTLTNGKSFFQSLECCVFWSSLRCCIG